MLPEPEKLTDHPDGCMCPQCWDATGPRPAGPEVADWWDD